MKATKLLFAAALCCGITLTSCSNDDEMTGSTSGVTSQTEVGDKAITFAEPFLEGLTRAEITSSNFASQTADLLVVREGENPGEEVVQAETTLYKSGSSWTTGETVYWYGDNFYFFFAYMPANLGASYTTNGSGGFYSTLDLVPLSADLSTGDDVLYAETVGDYKTWSSGVQLNFSHIYNKLSMSWNATASNSNFTIEVQSATLWLPKGSVGVIGNKFEYPNESSYAEELDASYVSTYYTSYDLTPNNATQKFTNNFLLAGNTSEAGYDNLYAYLDITYTIYDSEGYEVKTVTSEKQPIILSNTYVAPTGGKSTDIKISFDISSYIPQMTFSPALTSWSATSATSGTVY